MQMASALQARLDHRITWSTLGWGPRSRKDCSWDMQAYAHACTGSVPHLLASRWIVAWTFEAEMRSPRMPPLGSCCANSNMSQGEPQKQALSLLALISSALGALHQHLQSKRPLKKATSLAKPCKALQSLA